MLKKALRFKVRDVPRQENELIRLQVLSGVDVGVTFIILDTNVILGRAEECDIVLLDLKASRQHARLSLRKNKWILEDLNSVNGVYYKKKRIQTSELILGEEFWIGESRFRMINEDFLSSPFSEKKLPWEKVTKKNNLIRALLLAIGIGFLLWFTDEPKIKEKNDASSESALKMIPLSKNPQIENFLKEGLREYYAGNYYRAESQLRMVLQVYPTHPVASIYMSNLQKDIEKRIQWHMQHGKKDFELNRMKTAKGHFESILRYLYLKPLDARFIESQKYLKKIYEITSLVE